MIRLIATDLDGTLLEEDGTLPEGIFETVRELASLGIRFAACSGRQYDNLRRLFRPVSDQMAYICENGAISFLDGEVAGTIPMPDELAWEVIREMEAFEGMNLLISGSRVTYMKDENRTFTDDIVYRLRNTSAIVSSWEDMGEPMLKVACQKDGGVVQIWYDAPTVWTVLGYVSGRTILVVALLVALCIALVMAIVAPSEQLVESIKSVMFAFAEGRYEERVVIKGNAG